MYSGHAYIGCITSRHGDMALLGCIKTMISVVGIAWMRSQKVRKHEVFDLSRFVSVESQFTRLLPAQGVTTVAETLQCMCWRGAMLANSDTETRQCGHEGLLGRAVCCEYGIL